MPSLDRVARSYLLWEIALQHQLRPYSAFVSPDPERRSVSAPESPTSAPPEVASAPPAPPTTLPAEGVQAKPMLDTEKGARSLSKDRCGRRTIKSITLLPDGTAQMQC